MVDIETGRSGGWTDVERDGLTGTGAVGISFSSIGTRR